MSTLGTLQRLGNSTLGRVSVILCGSSAQLPALISTNDIKALETEFPLLANGSPNLNGTKYSAQRVWAPSSTDVKLAKTIVCATLPAATENAIRLLVFAIGTNPRELAKFAANHSFEPSDKRHSEMSTNFRNHPHARPFLNAILDALYKKNDKLLAGATKRTDLQNLTWLESFQPLSEEEIGKLWAKLLADRKINRTDKETRQATLFYLCDRGFVVYDSDMRQVYPDAVMTVVTCHHEKTDPAKARRIRKEATDMLMRAIPWVAKTAKASVA